MNDTLKTSQQRMVKIMLNAAHEKLCERLADLETRIMRHQYMLDNSSQYRPLGVMYGEKIADTHLMERQKELNRCREWFKQYGDTLQAVIEIAEKLRKNEAEAFAQFMAQRYAADAQQQRRRPDPHQ